MGPSGGEGSSGGASSLRSSSGRVLKSDLLVPPKCERLEGLLLSDLLGVLKYDQVAGLHLGHSAEEEEDRHFELA